MLVKEYVQRERARVAATRTLITEFHKTVKSTFQQLAKINKQHTADKEHVVKQLTDLANAVVAKLSPEASDDDVDQASELQSEINDLAMELEDIALTDTDIESLGADLKSMIGDVEPGFKGVLPKLSALERAAAKVGV